MKRGLNLNIAYYGVLILLVAVLLKEVLYIKELKISTKKTLGEVLIILIAIIAIVTITVVFSNNTKHYIVGCVGVGLLIVDWSKQGISNKGILLMSRGKEFYAWNQIKEVKINISNEIKVDYFDISHSKIISHHYSMIDYDRIRKEFEIHEVTYHTIQDTSIMKLQHQKIMKTSDD